MTKEEDLVVHQSFNQLNQYYKLLFPIKEFGRWLNYGSSTSSTFSNREFSFTLENDIYVRYQSFKDPAEFQLALTKDHNLATKIDIGAVYNMNPNLRKSILNVSKLVPVEKEYVLDLDMSDYDDVRTCCSGGQVCKKCWGYMTMAQLCLNHLLNTDFGFKHILFVYSGRRGLHAWVCDFGARKLQNLERASLTKYLDLKLVSNTAFPLQHLPPSIQQVYDLYLEPQFVHLCLVNQQLVSALHQYKLLRFCKQLCPAVPDAFISKARDAFDKISLQCHLQLNEHDTNESAILKWQTFCDLAEKMHKQQKVKDLFYLPRNLILFCLYPRLDMNVSVQLNHLLKSPFSMHPKTGRVCIPIDTAVCEQFDPTTVPTIMDLINDLNSEHVHINTDHPVPGI